MRILIPVCFLILLSGCSPWDKKYSNSTVTHDLKDIKDYGASSADTTLMRFYIDNKNFRKADLKPNTTYKELLELAKTAFIIRALNNIKANDDIYIKKSLEQARMDSMRNVISVSFVSKDYNDTGFKETIQMKFNIHNNYEKDVRAFKGNLIFKDVFGDVLKKYNMECDVLIPSHQAIMFTEQVKYDQLTDSDVKLLNADISKIQFSFDPILILFDDGSKMSL